MITYRDPENRGQTHIIYRCKTVKRRLVFIGWSKCFLLDVGAAAEKGNLRSVMLQDVLHINKTSASSAEIASVNYESNMEHRNMDSHNTAAVSGPLIRSLPEKNWKNGHERNTSFCVQLAGSSEMLYSGFVVRANYQCFLASMSCHNHRYQTIFLLISLVRRWHAYSKEVLLSLTVRSLQFLLFGELKFNKNK